MPGRLRFLEADHQKYRQSRRPLRRAKSGDDGNPANTGSDSKSAKRASGSAQNTWHRRGANTAETITANPIGT
jgi:hypothetical protein